MLQPPRFCERGEAAVVSFLHLRRETAAGQIARPFLSAFWARNIFFHLAAFNFGKKVSFWVKNMLLVCLTNRQSIVLISDKRSIYD